MYSIINNIIVVFAIISSISVIISSNPITSVIWLISVFVFSSVYLMSIGIYFVGISYLIVYVGAVAVLFIFVVIIINIQSNEIVSIGEEYTQNIPLGIFISGIFFYEIITIISNFYNKIELYNIFNIINNIFIFNNNSNSINFKSNSVNQFFDNFYPNLFINNQIKTVGEIIFINGSIWLIFVGFILLLGIIGPIALCLNKK